MNMNYILMSIMIIMGGNIKSTIIVVFVFIGAFIDGKSYAQIGDKGILLTEVSGGLSGYSLQTSQDFIESQAVTASLGANVYYNFHENVGFGIEFENHNYVDDQPDSVDVDYFGATRIGVGTQFHAVNNARFSLSFGMTVGLFSFGQNLKSTDSTSDIRATGVYQNFHVVARYYFGEKARFGIFLKGGLINNPMTFKSFELNGVAYDNLNGISVSDYRVTSTGIHTSIGLTYNWRIKEYN